MPEGRLRLGSGGSVPRPQASEPPSTIRSVPVMYAPPGEARNAIVAATSSGRPARRIGTWSRTRPRPPGRRTAARPPTGSVRRRRTPADPVWTTRSTPTRRSSRGPTAPIEEWAIMGIPRRGLNPRKARNAAAPRGLIQRSATRWVTSHVASTFSRCTARIPLSAIASSGAANCPRRCSPGCRPRRTVRPPPPRTPRPARPRGRRRASLVRSELRPHRAPAEPASSGSGRRPQIATLAPVRRAPRGRPPMPVPPPVTIATHRRSRPARAVNGSRRDRSSRRVCLTM